ERARSAQSAGAVRRPWPGQPAGLSTRHCLGPAQCRDRVRRSRAPGTQHRVPPRLCLVWPGCPDQATRSRYGPATGRLTFLPTPPHNARLASLQVGRFYFCKVNAMKATSLNRSNSKTRPALRLVSTKVLPCEDWLQIREQGIGSSDAAAAVGLNPYKSQLELWMEKTGRDAGMPKADPQDEESPMYWGNVLEPIVAWHYSKRTKHKVRRINAVLQHPDPELSWMLANIDREVIGADDVQILECKTAGINGARLWKEGVPEYVQLQVMHQLAVTGKQAADVAVLLGGQTLEIHRIERDEQMIARLIELERKFWHYVETDTPPPADGTASAESALRSLY